MSAGGRRIRKADRKRVDRTAVVYKVPPTAVIEGAGISFPKDAGSGT